MKRYVHGAILSIGAACALYFIVAVAVDAALEIAEKIQSGGVQPDMGSITDLLSQQSAGSDQAANIAMIALLVCWVIGIADSYRQGHAQAKLEEVKGKKKA